MVDITWFQVITSGAVISSLFATGAFVQKARDNSEKIIKLEARVEVLEGERPKIATLTEKIENIEARFSELRFDMKAGFEEIKHLLRESNCKM